VTRPRVLVGDDKENILKLFQKILGQDYDVVTAKDGTELLALAGAGDFDVIVTDIRMPGADGFTVLREVQRAKPDVEVILITAYASVPAAVQAMKEGAYDYLSKPFEPDEALLVVQRAVERRRLRAQARDLKRALEGSYRFNELVGKSPAMQEVFDLMHRAAATDATVLISGESGTGKELAARAIHFASARESRPFVAVNCGAIPETLIESELFGYVRGAFTGANADRRGLMEEANTGTLFLDEVGELPLALQVRFTRALQERVVRPVGATREKKVDVRVISATNVDLKAAVAARAFREDLYYRLNVFPIRLPPLRERREDILLLAAHLLERHGQRLGIRVEGFEPQALSALLEYDWPGNVRELENAIERSLAVSSAPRLPLEALPDEIRKAASDHPRLGQLSDLSYRAVMDLARDRTSREYLIALMRACSGNVTQAAERAAMERESLHRLLKRYGIRPEDFRARE